LYFAGHLGDPNIIAIIGLANVYMNVAFRSITIGLNITVSTFVSQSYGQGNMRLCGVYANQGRLIALMTLPVFILLALLASSFLTLMQ
jgi:Na+-driven multidrug efflux pump